MSIRGISVLGSTGSIGSAALRVIARHREEFRVVGLTSFGNRTLLRDQASEWRPDYVGMVTPSGECPPHWGSGPDCLVEAATLRDADIVINAVVGSAGLSATLAALRAGKRVALANKESLVMGGELVMRAAREGGGEIVPVDSEHSAVLQALGGREASDLRRIILTASGGPFREWTAERMMSATVEDALNHPTWRMGRKISVDSATLANKALEVIEAHHLFGLQYESIDVVVHPQSIVHSFVETVDGSVLAQLGFPNMELPILYALTYPERAADDSTVRFDPTAASPLTFESVDRARFPTLALGVAAGRTGGTAPAIFNAANESAVELFLGERIPYPSIARAVESALETVPSRPDPSYDDVVAADREARAHVERTFGL